MTDPLCGISQAGHDLIVTEETGGQAYYIRSGENHPSWPGGASGVTIGQGYDLGYSTPETVAGDWSPYLPANAISALQHCCGVTGSPAHALAQELHWINVPWEASLAVFDERDLPKWIGWCAQDLPNWDDLPPDCKGALGSIAFNRGRSWNIPPERDPHARYAEMRAIKAHMATKEFFRIPQDILSMRRLWPEGGDLWRRRGHEAVLFDQGLANAQPATPAAPGATS